MKDKPHMSSNNHQSVGVNLGWAFGLLVTILMGIGYLGLTRMNKINADLNEVLGKHWTKLQLGREALRYSNGNRSITMQIFLLTDRKDIEPLLNARADNSKKISQLLADIESRCDTPDERRLLTAVEKARTPYVNSYLRALHLLLDEKNPEAARSVMLQETTPVLLEYHAAWDDFLQLQMDEMDRAANASRADYAVARTFLLWSIVIAVLLTTAIAVLATRKTSREIQTRIEERDLAETRYNEEATVRNNVEDELQRSEERMRLAVQAAQIGVWDWDILGNTQVWSDTSKRLLGLSPDSPATFEVLMSRIHPDDRPVLWDEIKRTIEEKRDYAMEFRVFWPDGSLHWQAARGHAFYDGHGRAIRMTGIALDVTDRKLSEERLRLQAAALEAAANAIVITNKQGTIEWVNPAFSKLTGYEPDEVRGNTPRLLKSGEHDKGFYGDLWETITSGKVWHGELLNRRKDGSFYSEEQTITPVQGQNGEISHFVGIKQDITERKRIAQDLRDREDKLRMILDSTAEAVYGIDLDGLCTFCNPACLRILGYENPEDLLGKNMHDLIHHSYRDGATLPVDECRIFRAFKNGAGVHADDEVLWKANGASFPAEYWSYPQRKDSKVVGAVVTFIDITERKKAEEQIRALAFYDALTGLPNRILFQDRLRKALASARRHKEKVALLFFDVDRFKNVNDSLGHSVGDLLLKEVAERLKKTAREQDTVARLGGDEFVAILTAVQDVADAAVVADRLLSALSREIVIQGRHLNVTCSIGISLFPDYGTSAEVLAKNADAAMYFAKESGGNTFRFFTTDMNARATKWLTLENSLRFALERNELFVVYQPQVDIATGRITGAEALLRWRHPELGLISPSEFIPIAENSGLINPIGQWALRTACTQARRWQEQGLPALTVAVNLSAVQLRQENFNELVEQILAESGLPFQCLELELTESLLHPNSHKVLRTLQKLDAMGVSLAVDDFGTGYSNLGYLLRFRIHKLKIDRSFIQAMAIDPTNATITRAIIQMAKGLSLRVIAEGVETEEQLRALRMHGCDHYQGYYFSEPLLPDEFVSKVQETRLFVAARLGKLIEPIPAKQLTCGDPSYCDENN